MCVKNSKALIPNGWDLPLTGVTCLISKADVLAQEPLVMHRILIVDDDVDLFNLVKQFLEPEGFQVEGAHNGPRGLERALSGDYSLVVLDLMLPDMGGLDVLRNLRQKSNVPVLILTARGEDVDRIVGLEIGGRLPAQAIQPARAAGASSRHTAQVARQRAAGCRPQIGSWRCRGGPRHAARAVWREEG